MFPEEGDGETVVRNLATAGLRVRQMDQRWEMALVYDESDVWAVAPDSGGSRTLTDGRSSHIQFRVVRLDEG
jgi:hypothetical protein